MTQAAAERLCLGLKMFESEAIPIDRMSAGANCVIEGIGVNAIKGTKERVYAHIIEYLQFEGYPPEASADFKGVNVNDLALYVIGLIVQFLHICAPHRILKAKVFPLVNSYGEIPVHSSVGYKATYPFSGSFILFFIMSLIVEMNHRRLLL